MFDMLSLLEYKILVSLCLCVSKDVIFKTLVCQTKLLMV